ncbi:MAG: hypothetical protein QG549_322 [Patescibacteria group bacterium]|nr:hypothetical protein [Patescibacteria group bacterium]
MVKFSSFFSFFAVRYSYRHKQNKQTKMALKLDGSEASMLPILIEKSNILIGQTTKHSLYELAEFSVGRGIADLFVVKTDNDRLSRRKSSRKQPQTDLRSVIHCDALNDNVIERSIAIEAKVRDWRKGIKQAMRYKAFADKSYLAVYDDHISKPLEYIDIFKALNIGLIGVSDNGVEIYFEPSDNYIDAKKSYLASERVYSVIDDTKDSFVVRNQFAPHSVPA